MGTGPLTTAELEEKARVDVELPRLLRLVRRPRTRGDCADVPRPCPFVSCRHHLYLDVTHGGAVKLLSPDREPSDLPAAWSCSLDVAERLEHRGASLPQIGRALNVSMARSGQIVDEALAKLREHPDGPGLMAAYAEEATRAHRATLEDYADPGIMGKGFAEAVATGAARYGPPMVSRVVRARRR